jgi:hypothetical protein
MLVDLVEWWLEDSRSFPATRSPEWVSRLLGSLRDGVLGERERLEIAEARVREVEAERDEAYDARDKWIDKAQRWGSLLVDAQATVARQAETLRNDLRHLSVVLTNGVTDDATKLRVAREWVATHRAVLASPEAAATEPETRCIGRVPGGQRCVREADHKGLCLAAALPAVDAAPPEQTT